MKPLSISSAALALSFLLIGACAQRDKQGNVLDTPTTGRIKVLVDENYKPYISSCTDVFDSIYRQASIDAAYVSEGEAVKALIDDSVQVIIISRKLNEEEMAYFQSRGFTPPQTPIAHDAIGFILNPQNRDTVFDVEQMRKILSGAITNWRQINAKSNLGAIQVVFDNPLSGSVRFAKDSIAGGVLTPHASALKTNEEVIAYVAKNKNALGIIGANWISDTDDKGVQKFLQEIRIAEIAKAPGEVGYGPLQSYLAAGYYPYKRTVYVINAQARKGLGLGFSAFLAGDGGQRIALKEGLLPAQAPTRLIKVER